jgi:hypothetical protein
MEVANGLVADERVWWTPFWFGCVAGVVPWVGIGIYLFGAGVRTGASTVGATLECDGPRRPHDLRIVRLRFVETGQQLSSDLGPPLHR